MSSLSSESSLSLDPDSCSLEIPSNNPLNCYIFCSFAAAYRFGFSGFFTGSGYYSFAGPNTDLVPGGKIIPVVSVGFYAFGIYFCSSGCFFSLPW